MPEEIPENTSAGVTLTKAEHDQLQAENRRLKKQATDAAAAEEARRAKDAADVAAAKGEFEKARGIEQAENDRLRLQLAQTERKDQLRDELLARGLTGSQARMVLKVAETAGEQFDAKSAVDVVVADYPDIFTPKTSTEETPPPMRRTGPTQQPNRSSAPFEGYISPEEYVTFPQATRLSAKFQERLALSRPYWPTTFDARNLPNG